jgi:hypothetical protein
VSLRAYLAERGVGGADSRVVRELVGAVNRVNYNQDNGLNALAGVVSLCPMVTGEVWTVGEGNAALAQVGDCWGTGSTMGTCGLEGRAGLQKICRTHLNICRTHLIGG